MTGQELLNVLKTFSHDVLSQDLTIRAGDEYYAVAELYVSGMDDSDVLDEGNLVLQALEDSN